MALTTPYPEFHLGIIGGCLARQAGECVCQLYPYRLVEAVRAATGVTLRLRIARYEDGSYARRLGQLAAAGPLDGVILHLRSMIVRKTGLIVKHCSPQATVYALHPFAFGARHANWTESEESAFAHCLRIRRTVAAAAPSGGVQPAGPGNPPPLPQDVYDQPLAPRRALGLSFGQWNRLAGRLAGLEDWAIRDEVAEVDAARRLSSEMGARLAILAPLPAPQSPWIERFGARLTDRLRSYVAPYPVPICQVKRETRHEVCAMFMGDGIHMNAVGHNAVVAALLGTVVDWVRPV